MKKYVVSFPVWPIVPAMYGRAFHDRAKEVIKCILSRSKVDLKRELEAINENKDELDAFYKNSVRVAVYLDEDSYHKWRILPRKYKRALHYFLAKKLSEGGVK